MLINLNTVVDGGDGTSDSIVEFRPQGKFDFLLICFSSLLFGAF